MEIQHPKLITRLIIILYSILIVHVCTFAQESDIELRRISGQGNGGISLELKTGMNDSILNSSESYYAQLVYQPNKGPVDVRIYNSQICPLGTFTISLTGVNDTSKWKVYSHLLDSTIICDSTIYSDYEQDITEWGMLIRTKPVENPGEVENSYDNGYLNSKIIYQDSSRQWYSSVPDYDIYGSSLNWIRSGSDKYYTFPEYNDWDVPLNARDYQEVYENVISRTWSPYLLTAARYQDIAGPAYSIVSKVLNDFQQLASIDLVLTNDSSKWSRCCVIEMCYDSNLAQGNAIPFSLRNHSSVNINGDTNITSANQLLNSNYVSPEGMGWFPGYAINLETGERLNIIFGENTYYIDENGRDMIWNPTSKIIEQPSGDPIFGGFHNIYIMGAVEVDTFNFPRYDQGQYIHNLLSSSQNDSFKDYIFASTYWVSVPLKNPSEEWLSNDVTLKLRVSKKYNYFENNEPPKYEFENKIDPLINDNSGLFVMYPNPTSEKLTIVMNDLIVGTEVNLMVYNYLGVQINGYVFSDAQKRNELNVSNFISGVYVLEVSSDNLKYTRKLIICN